jgi:hypothetical protein
MQRRVMVGGLIGGALLAGGAAALGWRHWRRGPALPPARAPMDLAAFDALTAPLPPPQGPLATYHLGHSLVGRDMPAFLAQLAGHDHALQIGWGTPLRAHWEDRIEVPGLETLGPDAKTALAGGAFGAVVLTEMVELRDAIQWHASAQYLALWARAARAGNPHARVYLYETWHRLDDPQGWLDRIDADLAGAWVGVLLRGAAAEGAGGPIHLVPAGQAMATVARAAESGQVPGLARREDLFSRQPDGSQDMIHLSDLGHYLVALTHYATIYQRNPVGLPTALARADGSRVEFGGVGAALHPLVWQAVTAAPYTGLAA